VESRSNPNIKTIRIVGGIFELNSIHFISYLFDMACTQSSTLHVHKAYKIITFVELQEAVRRITRQLGIKTKLTCKFAWKPCLFSELSHYSSERQN
jgi:hypothetical protein